MAHPQAPESATVKALPAILARYISASNDIYDTKTVLKELIDNSLDAKATSVAVEVSMDIVETIQVRDNGTGITPGDRPVIARRHFTSKIRDMDDLRRVGGTSLGFRGVALSSIAAMSGAMTIMTRVEGDDVAVKLHIGRNGEVTREERASASNGTTVRVSAYLKHSPVRKKMAIQDAATALVQIKRLLQAYALARPTARLSLRVLGAKSDKGNFIYAPRPGAGPEDAVLKALGRNVGSQCSWSLWKENGYEIRAFLPRIDAEPAKISGFGSFISVDSRPVSAARDNAKELEAAFKQRFKGVYQAYEGVSRPFVYLDIHCPTASYDANIEPAKDDVLFHDKESLMLAVHGLLIATYPHVNTNAKNTSTTSPTTDTTDAEALFENSQPSDIIGLSFLPEAHIPDVSQPTLTISNTMSDHPRDSMYDFSNGDAMETRVGIEPPTVDLESEAEDLWLRGSILSNPWTIAKMNAPSKRRDPIISYVQQPSPPSSDPIDGSLHPNWFEALAPHSQRCPRELQRSSHGIEPTTSMPRQLNNVRHARVVGAKGLQASPAGLSKFSGVQDHISGDFEHTLVHHALRSSTPTLSERSTAACRGILPFKAVAAPRLRRTFELPSQLKQAKLKFTERQGTVPSDCIDGLIHDRPTISKALVTRDAELVNMAGVRDQPHSTHAAFSSNSITQGCATRDPQTLQELTAGVRASKRALETLSMTASCPNKPLRTASNPGARIYRTRSAGLPLERVPNAAAMQNVVVTVNLSQVDLVSLTKTFASIFEEDISFISNATEAELQFWATRIRSAFDDSAARDVTPDKLLVHLKAAVTQASSVRRR